MLTQEDYKQAVVTNTVQDNDFISDILIEVFVNKSDEIFPIIYRDNALNKHCFPAIYDLVKQDVADANDEALWSNISTDDEIETYINGFIAGIYSTLDFFLKNKEPVDNVETKKQDTKISIKEKDRDFNFMGNDRSESAERSGFQIVDTGKPSNPLLEGEARQVELDNVSNAIDYALDNRIDSAYAGDNSVHLLKAPTGSGKTSRLISKLVADPRTYEDVRVINGDRTHLERRPILVLMPNHHNIAEAVARAKMLTLNPDLPDSQLVDRLIECKFIENSEDAFQKLDEVRDSIRRCNRDINLPPLNISVMESRARAGCFKQDEMKLLAKAGIGQSSLCQSRNRNIETEKMEDVYCEFYNSCNFIKMRKQLGLAHIIFMPHSYLTIKTIPEEIKNPRFVVIDERIQEQVLKYDFINLQELMQPRQRTIDVTRQDTGYEPRNEEDRERMEKQLMSLLQFQRKEAARSWCAYQLNACSETDIEPAQYFINLQEANRRDELVMEHEGEILPSPLDTLDLGMESLVEIGKRDPRIKPGIDINLLNIICSNPGSSTVQSEKKLWEIIKDRIMRLREDQTMLNLRKDYENEWLDRINNEFDEQAKEKLKLDYEVDMNKFDERHPRKATGKYDHRLQFLDMRSQTVGGIPSRVIRLSWREEINWADKPVLLLDASAYTPIIAKIWDNIEVKTTDVVKDFGKLLNVKIVGVMDHAWSNSSMLSSTSSSFWQRISSGVALASVRDAASVISAVHANGRVLLGANKKVREALQHNWQPPVNMDTCHYGAIRGIDVWKHHAATMSIGRMDLPIELIDAMAASLTWDEEHPESPFNIYGNGFADKECQQVLYQKKKSRAIRMRDGRSIIVGVPMVEGKWGSLCQKQSREEELLQFLGRLRPIYREGKTPIHYAFSSVIPEGLILDDCVMMRDIIGEDNSGLLIKDKTENKISISMKKSREYNALLTRILDAAVRVHNGVLCPEVLAIDYWNVDLLNKDRSAEFISGLLNHRGFRMDGSVDPDQNMADGWSLYGYSISGDIMKPIWIMSSIHFDPQKTLSYLTDYLVDWLGCDANDIEIGIYNLANGTVINESMDKHGHKYFEDADIRLENFNVFLEYIKHIRIMEYETQKRIDKETGEEIEIKVKTQNEIKLIEERSCDAPYVSYQLARKKYFISNYMAKLMTPFSPRLTGDRAIKDKERMDYTCEQGLYYHQLMGVLALQDVYGPCLEDLVKIIENTHGVKEIDPVYSMEKDINITFERMSPGRHGKSTIVDHVDFQEFRGLTSLYE